MTTTFAVSASGLVLVAFVVLMVVGGALAYYRRGPRMDINQRPVDSGPGRGASRISSAEDETEGTFDSRGLR